MITNNFLELLIRFYYDLSFQRKSDIYKKIWNFGSRCCACALYQQYAQVFISVQCFSSFDFSHTFIASWFDPSPSNSIRSDQKCLHRKNDQTTSLKTEEIEHYGHRCRKLFIYGTFGIIFNQLKGKLNQQLMSNTTIKMNKLKTIIRLYEEQTGLKTITMMAHTSRNTVKSTSISETP